MLEIRVELNCVQRVWIVKRFFLIEKQTFNGLLKVIGIQNYTKFILFSDYFTFHHPTLLERGIQNLVRKLSLYLYYSSLFVSFDRLY